MSDLEAINKIVNAGTENEMVDFKREFYKRLSNSDVAKDVAAFANVLGKSDKYIIFGIDDISRELVGVDPRSVCNIDDLDNYLYQTIEPHISVELDSVEIDGKVIAYIKIPSTNQDPPYIIKKACGSTNKIERGDVYIRKGTCNQKASRLDLDYIYNRSGRPSVELFDSYIIIEPIYMKSSIPNNPTYGMLKLEIANLSDNPLLICGGYIEISNSYGKIRRSICSVLPQLCIAENPLQILPRSRNAYNALFDFLSDDCLSLRFDEDGHQLHDTFAQVVLLSSDDQEITTKLKQVYIFAKGDILHKIKCFYKEMRKTLKNNAAQLVKSIAIGDSKRIHELLPDQIYTFLQPGFVLGNPDFPEYDYAYQAWKAAVENNQLAIETLKKRGMSDQFIAFCKERYHDRSSCRPDMG